MEREDWSESLDDMEPGDWEDHFGGPDDKEFELMDKYQEYENIEVDSFELDRVNKPYANNIDSGQKSNQNVTREEEIINWLISSKLSINFKNNKGFFVPKGPHVRLANGSVVDLLEWLVEEGIKGGKAISGYSIAYTEPGGKYGEKLSFFKIVLDTPFSPKSSNLKGSSKNDEEETPF